MMIRDILDIYNRNWSQILIWSFVLILPVTAVSFLSMIYVYSSEYINSPEYFSVFAIILNFIICIPPFMKMVIVYKQDHSINSLEGISYFVKQFGILFIFTGILYFIAVVGIYFLFIPTILALVFLLIFPFFSEGRNVKEVYKNTIQAMMRENVSLIGELIVIFSINIGCWVIMMLFLSQYENNIFAFMVFRVLLNALVFPFLYIYLTLRFRKELSNPLMD
ncbi:hypothetical protein [Ureibacillus sinduriensis]|uniref:Glycerophosphoryl diester phosphodiesterase membrane domain-containing protein n=1 Tax=Ureibacillus sinduriensis BLB-1 = JCM 15800 TaxID=1384057 RepID=A0A0A3INN6_9BACL|nr:hypothetical protein [Ureibacillus sinduriensis]KGR76452.1 hypothetical protein CD33_06165 [Ureibacillus sinduriensis BLB-1 = JCM 15800]